VQPDIKRLPIVVRIGRDVAPRQQNGAGGDWNIEKKNRAPTAEINEPTSKYRPDRTCGSARRGPDADRSALGLTREGLSQNRKAVRHQHCGACALHQPRPQKPDEARRDRATNRGECE
jgi:hypothetical protein